MDIILGFCAAAAGLAVLLYFHFTKSVIAQRICRLWPTLTQKVMVALLAGFMLFTAISPFVPRLLQKVLLILVAASLAVSMSIHVQEKKV